MLKVDDEERNIIKEILNKTIEYYGKHDFLGISYYETDSLIKRQIDNYHDLQNRGLEEVIKNFFVISIDEVVAISDNAISVGVRASVERYIKCLNNSEVIDGTRDYVAEKKYEFILTKSEGKSQSSCMYCGAIINEDEVKCPYCGTPIIAKNSNWLVADIKEV